MHFFFQIAQRPRPVPVLRGAGAGELPRRAGRNVRARMRAAAARPEEDEGLGCFFYTFMQGLEYTLLVTVTYFR